MKKYLSKIKNSFKSLSSIDKINPYQHWKYLINIFLGIIIIMIFSSFYLLFKIKNQQIFQVPPKTTESPNLINEKLLNEVIDSFKTKALKEKEIKNIIPIYSDPSL